MMGWLRGQVARVIFGVLLVAFLAWIVVDLGMQGRVGDSTGAVAVVNGEKIAGEEFWRLYNQEVDGTWGALKGGFSEAEEKVLRREVLGRLADQLLAWQAARSMGLSVNRKEALAALRTYPAFLNEQGQFDPMRYQAVLNQIGLTPRAFEAEQERSMSVARVEGAIRESVRATDDELWLEYLRRHRRMKAVVLAYPFAEARTRVKVTDGEVRTYWQDNRRLYEHPERVRIRHIVVAVNPQGGPEAQAQARAKVDGISAELKKGGDFIAIARRSSDDANTQARGGDLGWHAKGELISEYEAVAFKLRKGQVSDPFQTKFGFHLLKCDEHQLEEKPTFDEVKAKIRAKLLDERARTAARESVTRALWAQRTEKDLLKVAKAVGRTPIVTGWFEAGKVPPAGLSGKAAAALAAAMSPLEPGDTTPLVEAGDGFYLSQLRDEEHHRAPETGFLKERAEVESALVLRKQKAFVDAWLAGLRAKAKIRMMID